MNIQELILRKAKVKKNKILIIEGEDERMVKAAEMAVKNDICFPALLGEKNIIQEIANQIKVNLDGVEILDYMHHPDFDKFAEQLYEIRKNKGLKLEQAKEWLKNPNYFGALMLRFGKYDGAVGGCKFSTADWMRPVFQVVGTKENVSLVSAVCFMEIKDKIFFFSDTDFNIKPNNEQLAQIAINAADFVKGLGFKPKVAFLSYSTKGSGEHESLGFIREALNIVKGKRKDIIIDGEMQLDAAVNPDANKRKCPDSILKGEANIFIFPDITVGNVLIHGLGQWTNYKLYGSFPVGLAKPIINGGRSWNAEQIYDAITACSMEVNL